jgi:hypothetical protein
VDQHLDSSRIGDRYDVFETLGQGGMGSVFRVLDRSKHQELALKRLSKTAAADAAIAALFEREFHTLSELAHPSIIEVYDYGIDGELPYYTMELLRGQDLRALGKLPWRKACELLCDVASSLAIIHSRRLVHADVSPRNVRCTDAGRAKLFDFGAMVPMGVSKRIVGTPPFIAPEMLNLQPLDGRADLYAFGGVAYLLLTGRLAYPAQDVTQLRDLWRRTVPAVTSFDPQAPQALSDLVAELVQLNPNARPRSAGEVMQRLASIAGLAREEAPEVASAYLATPTLVGRDAQLTEARKRLISTIQGRGGVMVISAAPGGGRSRFLDSCVLEAKLLGLQVVRAQPSDAEQGVYGAARSFCRKLFELAPQGARDAARFHEAVLSHVIGADLLPGADPARAPDRAAVVTALRDFALSVSRSLRLLIAVDDADDIDDLFATMLVALGQKSARRGLCVMLAIDSEAGGSAALDVLMDLAGKLALPPLTEAQTEQLLGAIFGNTHHLVTVARRVHALARGNPRAIMQLATHLVEHGIARYEAGSFVLPERLREQDLPASLAGALELRIQRLDPNARELGQILALTDPSQLAPSAYLELTQRDRASTYRAIDELVRAQVLEPHGDRYRLSDPTWSTAFAASLTPEQRVQLHARLAKVFEASGTLTRRSYHLLESDQPEAAIRLMLAQFIKDPNEPKDPLADYVPGLIDQIERAAIAAEALNLPAPLRIELRMKLAGASQFLGDIPRFLRTAPATLRELEIASGLAEYDSLDPAMEPMARLTEALTRVQQRYDAAAGKSASLAPIDAIRELARCCVMFAGVAAISQDTQLIETVPSLAPFVPLSPAVAAIEAFISIARALLQSRDDDAREALPRLIARLEQPDGAGLGQLYCKSMRLGALYRLGLIEASDGQPEAARRVAPLENEPGHRLNAERVHMVCHLMQGDVEAAIAAQRRAELVMLQDGQQQRYPGTTSRSELLAFWLSNDSIALKQLSERLTGMVETSPHWMGLMHAARCMHRLAQGDAPGGLREIEPALARVAPRRSRDWTWVAVAHLHALLANGRAREAVSTAQMYEEQAEAHNISGRWRILHAMAEGMILDGRASEAAKIDDALIEQARARGVRGLALGALYEQRARAAIALGDDDNFYAFCQLCAEEYRPDRHPLLAARYQRLLREAQQKRAGAEMHAPAISRAPQDSAISIVHSRIVECEGPVERARCALALLAESAGATEGYFYALRGGRAELVCASPEQPAPLSLQGAVDTCLREELARIDASESDTQPVSGDHTGSHERYVLVPLAATSLGQRLVAGVVALHASPDGRSAPEPALREAIASALIEHDDVDASTCIV